jgi:hypothetical protein
MGKINGRECEATELLMSNCWRQLKEEISNARNRTLMLAVIASFIAWLITHLLRLAFG